MTHINETNGCLVIIDDHDVRNAIAILETAVNETIPVKNLMPLSVLSSTHDTVSQLCDGLEAVADSLPSNVDRESCRLLAETLTPRLKDAQTLEEEHIFPALRHAGEADEALQRLLQEHFEDLCFAEEASESLKSLAQGHATNIEAVGYLLRGLFTTLRRHIAFERQVLENGRV